MEFQKNFLRRLVSSVHYQATKFSVLDFEIGYKELTGIVSLRSTRWLCYQINEYWFGVSYLAHIQSCCPGKNLVRNHQPLSQRASLPVPRPWYLIQVGFSSAFQDLGISSSLQVHIFSYSGYLLCILPLYQQTFP